MLRLTSLPLLILVACTSTDVEPDPSIDPPGALPGRYLIARGAAGLETLFAVVGETTTAISTPGTRAWCNNKPFCNLPPNGEIGRFTGTRFVGETHAFYVDLDVDAWSNTRVVSAELATAAQTNLAADVPWPASTPDWPLFYVVATATTRNTSWVSLPIEGGMALYRTDGRTSLVEVARVPQPSGRTWMESSISTGAHGLAWSVRWRGGPAEDPHNYVTRVFDADGDLMLRVPEDVDGAADGGGDAFVIDDVVAITWQDASLDHAVGLYQLASRELVRIPGRTYVHSHAPGGDGLVALGSPGDDRIRLVDAHTGAQQVELDGWPYRFGDGRVEYRSRTTRELVERDLRADTERVLAPGTSISLDAMGGVFAPADTTLAVASGAPFLDLAENVGIELVDAATLVRTEVEPAATSEHFVRRMKFSSNGDWLLYLHPVGDALQLVGYRVEDGERRTLTTGAENVRQLWLE